MSTFHAFFLSLAFNVGKTEENQGLWHNKIRSILRRFFFLLRNNPLISPTLCAYIRLGEIEKFKVDAV